MNFRLVDGQSARSRSFTRWAWVEWPERTTRSENREVGVRNWKPSVVVGNGLSRFEVLLLAELFEMFWENGA